MARNQRFQHQPSAIASYNYTDISEGTGVVQYQGFMSSTSTGDDFHLGTNTLYSVDIESVAAGDPSASIDIDFDLTEFNQPQTIRGTALVQFTMFAQSITSGVGGASAVIKINKWDGTTETELATVTSESISLAGGEAKAIMVLCPLSILRTSFKKGESLRVNVVATVTRASGSGSMRIALGHDPLNRDGTYINPSSDDPTTTTQFNVYIPYDIDI